MENQHKLIKGYRDLPQADIDLINRIKEHGETTRQLLAEVMDRENINVPATLPPAEDRRWAHIAKTHFQQGYMALTRAVTLPTHF